MRYKNFFVLKTRHKNNIMLISGRGWLTYLFSSNPQIQLWHCCLGHANNARLIQSSKLINEINLKDVSEVIEESYSFNSKSDNDSDKGSNNQPIFIIKVTDHIIEGIEELCKVFVKNKHIKIVKLKKMIPIIRRLQKV